jgi:hypothetical protein
MSDTGPFGVIRHGTYFAVVDKRYADDKLGGFRRVSHHRSRDAAWAKCKRLERERKKEAS